MRSSFSLTAFARRFSSLCRERGLGDAELSLCTGISPEALCGFRTATRIPRLDEACALADALDCSLDALLGRVELRLVA